VKKKEKKPKRKKNKMSCGGGGSYHGGDRNSERCQDHSGNISRPEHNEISSRNEPSWDSRSDSNKSDNNVGNHMNSVSKGLTSTSTSTKSTSKKTFTKTELRKAIVNPNFNVSLLNTPTKLRTALAQNISFKRRALTTGVAAKRLGSKVTNKANTAITNFNNAANKNKGLIMKAISTNTQAMSKKAQSLGIQPVTEVDLFRIVGECLKKNEWIALEIWCRSGEAEQLYLQSTIAERLLYLLASAVAPDYINKHQKIIGEQIAGCVEREYNILYNSNQLLKK
jgi:hypothetical protein